jgi:glycosyltransferase involved in cell wall biosynthesis
MLARNLRRECRDAYAACYVTREALQKRYPTRGEEFAVSDVILGPGALAAEPRMYYSPQVSFQLVTVGSLQQMYKGTDVLIGAVAACVQQGLDLTLHVVGDGKHRPELEALAEYLGISERVRFRGELPAPIVRAELDAADMFVLPSRTEGLPRAMIEAMARGLPCIWTNLGGKPEKN